MKHGVYRFSYINYLVQVILSTE